MDLAAVAAIVVVVLTAVAAFSLLDLNQLGPFFLTFIALVLFMRKRFGPSSQ